MALPVFVSSYFRLSDYYLFMVHQQQNPPRSFVTDPKVKCDCDANIAAATLSSVKISS